MLISENWGELLEPTLNHIFDKNAKGLPDYIPMLYNVERSSKAVETTLGVGGLGTMDEWTGSVSYEDINKGYSKTYRHKKYSKGLQIERELLEDDQYSEIRKRVRMLSQSVYMTRQTHAASPFNNAFAAGDYAGPDSVALCSSAHPHSPSDATTQSNTTTNTLSAANVETARTAMMAWTDDKGNKLPMNPDTLIVAPAKRKIAKVIAGTELEPESAQNDINVWKGSLNVIEHRYLTSNTNSWFLVDSRRMKMFLNWYNRRIPKLERDIETFSDEVSKYKCVGRWIWGFDDWSWVYGANATS